MMTVQEQFLQKTHIDPNYFLTLVLGILGQIDNGDLTIPNQSVMFPVDENGERVGRIEILGQVMVIYRSL